MRKCQIAIMTALLFAGTVALSTGCNTTSTSPARKIPDLTVQSPEKAPGAAFPAADDATNPAGPASSQKVADKPGTPDDRDAVQVVANPEDTAVLVNKKLMLPPDYKPSDLEEPNVPFIFSEKDEKRLMRKEAAEALEKLFAKAREDGVHLAGVSAYRSYETQKWLFDYYVRTQGEENARKYSAEPGHSEHQTGLAIDVSGIGGKCAVEDCFADTPEAKWLAEHASRFGFIIRYPKGKESVTGYNYEPWHLRYVGTKLSLEIAEKGLTLEEYLLPIAGMGTPSVVASKSLHQNH